MINHLFHNTINLNVFILCAILGQFTFFHNINIQSNFISHYDRLFGDFYIFLNIYTIFGNHDSNFQLDFIVPHILLHFII